MFRNHDRKQQAQRIAKMAERQRKAEPQPPSNSTSSCSWGLFSECCLPPRSAGNQNAMPEDLKFILMMP